MMGFQERQEEERSEPVLEQIFGTHHLRREIEPHRQHVRFVRGMPEEAGFADPRLSSKEDEARLALQGPVELASNEIEFSLAAGKSRRRGTPRGLARNN
jgi:hypothetical protein